MEKGIDDDGGALSQRDEKPGPGVCSRCHPGPGHQLNLLRFRAIADYSADPMLAPPTPISGAAAFDRYVAHTLPYLRLSGGSIVASYEGGSFLIGPAGERWDRVLLIRQASIDAFLAFARDAAYLAGLGHRTAALEDSRLLPLTESAPFG